MEKEIPKDYFKKFNYKNGSKYDHLKRKGNEIILMYFDSYHRKSFSTFSTVDINYMILFFEQKLKTTKGNFSIKKLDELLSDNDISKYSFSYRFTNFCEEYIKRKKGKAGKTILIFAEKYEKKHRYHSTEKYASLKKNVEIKKVLDTAKELKNHLNCNTEQLLDILFGTNYIETNYKKSSLRNYFFD